MGTYIITIIKFALFLVVVLLFTLALYRLISTHWILSGVPNMFEPFFLFLVSVVLGVVILVVIIKGTKLYLFIFLLLFLPMMIIHISKNIIQHIETIKEDKRYEKAQTIVDEAKKLGDTPQKVVSLLRGVDDAYSQPIGTLLIETYVELMILHGSTPLHYRQEIRALSKEHHIRLSYRVDSVVSRYQSVLQSETSYLNLFQLLKVMKLAPSSLSSTGRAIDFFTLVKKGYHQAALVSLGFGDNKEYTVDNIQEWVKDEKLKQAAIQHRVKHQAQEEKEKRYFEQSLKLIENTKRLTDPKQVDKVLKSIDDSLMKHSITYADRLGKQKAILYLKLTLQGYDYKKAYYQILREYELENFYVLNDYLKVYKLQSQEQYLIFFDFMEKEDDIAYFGLVLEEPSFQVLIEKGFYKAALRSLDFSRYRSGYKTYISKVKDRSYREKIIQKLRGYR